MIRWLLKNPRDSVGFDLAGKSVEKVGDESHLLPPQPGSVAVLSLSRAVSMDPASALWQGAASHLLGGWVQFKSAVCVGELIPHFDPGAILLCGG